MLLNELSNNLDAYWKSVYIVKQPDAGGARGRLEMTPLWDFNLSFGNGNIKEAFRATIFAYKQNRFGGECSGAIPKTGPQCATAPPCGYFCCTIATGGKCWNMPYVPFWFERLWSDARFQNELKCRWNELRKGPYQMAFVDARIREWTRQLKPLPIRRHFARWPETRRGVSFNPCGRETPDPCGSPTAPVEEFFDYETNWFRGWIDRRIKWLDQNLPGTCGT